MLDAFFVVSCICFAVIPTILMMRKPREHPKEPVDVP